MRFASLLCCFSTFSKKQSEAKHRGLESVFYNGTNVTEMVEELVEPDCHWETHVEAETNEESFSNHWKQAPLLY